MDTEKISPLRAIKEHCLDCSNGQKQEVKLCPVTECKLYPFRNGKNPFSKRKLTEEQKQILAERMKNIRK